MVLFLALFRPGESGERLPQRMQRPASRRLAWRRRLLAQALQRVASTLTPP